MTFFSPQQTIPFCDLSSLWLVEPLLSILFFVSFVLSGVAYQIDSLGPESWREQLDLARNCQ